MIMRHCSAEGQEDEAPLTKLGIRQAQVVATFMEHYPVEVDFILSSPAKRAINSVVPLAKEEDIDIETDERLLERHVSAKPLKDMESFLETSFKNYHVKLEDGESNQEAMDRVAGLLDELFEEVEEDAVPLLVTHGNLFILILNYLGIEAGFTEWKELTHPDLYMVTKKDGSFGLSRIWSD